jgi:hypothetical protein
MRAGGQSGGRRERTPQMPRRASQAQQGGGILAHFAPLPRLVLKLANKFMLLGRADLILQNEPKLPVRMLG